MENKILTFMYRKNVESLLDMLHDLKLHREELLIELTAIHGYSYKDLRTLKKSDIKDVYCKVYLDSKQDDDLVFEYTNQHLNLILQKKVQDRIDGLSSYDNFTIHFFRRSYGMSLYHTYRYVDGYSFSDAVRKVGAQLGHYHEHKTLEYLRLDREVENKVTSILRGPSDDETRTALKEDRMKYKRKK